MNNIFPKFITLFILITCSSYLFSQSKTWNLKACIDTAYKKNISLNQGKLNTDINKINYTQSRAAQLPNLNLTDGQNFNYGYSLDPYTYQYTNQYFATNSITLTSTVTLFNGYLLLNTVKQNKLIYDASALDVDKIKNDILLNVVAGYMQVLMDHDAIDVAQAQIESDNTQVDETEKFVKFGKVAELNLLQVQSQLAADKLTKVNTENQLQLDRITLLQIMNVPAMPDFDVERSELTDLFPEIPVSTEEIDKISEGFLPQIKSAAIKTNAAVFSLKMAKSGWYPKLTLSGSLRSGYSSLRNNLSENIFYQPETIGYLNDLPSQPVVGMVPQTIVNQSKDPLSSQFKNNFNQVIGLNITVPIFNNLQVKSAVETAKINVMNAELNEQQTRNDLRKAIETAYTNQVSAGKKLVATQEQMVLEKRTYSDMEKKYAVGAMDATTFLIEKNNYNKVAMSLIQAKYDYVLKTKIVNFYLGKSIYN